MYGRFIDPFSIHSIESHPLSNQSNQPNQSIPLESPLVRTGHFLDDHDREEGVRDNEEPGQNLPAQGLIGCVEGGGFPVRVCMCVGGCVFWIDGSGWGLTNTPSINYHGSTYAPEQRRLLLAGGGAEARGHCC